MVLQFTWTMPPGCGGCCAFCHDAHGDTLPATFSGVLACSGCYTNGGNDYSFVLTGLNGSFNLTWDVGNLDWEANRGNLELKKYSSSDGTCVGEIDSENQDIPWFVSCTGEDVFTVAQGVVTLMGFSFSIFNAASTGGPGDAILNANTVGGCGVPGGAGYDGQITIDV